MIVTRLIEILRLATSAFNSPFSDTQNVLSEPRPSFSKTCQEIATSVSSMSNVYVTMSPEYLKDISHWSSSSTQFAACSFEPRTPEDVGVALAILGRTRTPFAVKGGGHTTNPGFSSTEGVQIAMTRFSEVVYDSMAQIVTVGAGLTWDEVYEQLEPRGVNVAGGRISGVGVAGFTLGGGYSWHTNQYGLTIDNIRAYELVVPNGTIIDVSETSSPDLFFALKGGLNNYGIVTKFTFKTFPQMQVWGGLVSYSGDVVDQVIAATANFAENNTDPKAAIISVYRNSGGQLGSGLNIFYDAPAPPAGIFDEFLAIPSSTRDVATRSFPSFLKSLYPSTSGPGRAAFNTISLASYPASFIQSLVKEINYWKQNLPDDVGYISYDVQPFLPSLFSHNTTPSAYPPTRARALFPLNIVFAWGQAGSDQAVYNASRTTAKTLQAQAIDHGNGCVPPVIYPNYALFDTPVEYLYGENLHRLQAIKIAVDPENVMGLAGGFRI